MIGISSLAHRLEKHTNKTESCWKWQSVINKNGYGTIFYNYKKIGAHRAAWIVHKGEIPKDMYVCHSCDVRDCVNPSHLFLGTARDNLHDAIKKGRWACPVGNKQLCIDEVKKIKEILNKKVFTQLQIAKQFGVARTTISAINCGYNWRAI